MPEKRRPPIQKHLKGEKVEASVDTFMLQFQPFAPEIRRFAEEIMPRVRSLALVA